MTELECALEEIEARFTKQANCHPKDTTAIEAINRVADSIADVPRLVQALRLSLEELETYGWDTAFNERITKILTEPHP